MSMEYHLESSGENTKGETRGRSRTKGDNQKRKRQFLGTDRDEEERSRSRSRSRSVENTLENSSIATSVEDITSVQEYYDQDRSRQQELENPAQHGPHSTEGTPSLTEQEKLQRYFHKLEDKVAYNKSSTNSSNQGLDGSPPEITVNSAKPSQKEFQTEKAAKPEHIIASAAKVSSQIGDLDDLIKKVKSLTIDDQSPITKQDSSFGRSPKLDLGSPFQGNTEQDSQIVKELTEKFQELSIQEDKDITQEDYRIKFRKSVRKIQMLNVFVGLAQELRELSTENLQKTLDDIEYNKKAATILMQTFRDYAALFIYNFASFKQANEQSHIEWERCNLLEKKLNDHFKIAMDTNKVDFYEDEVAYINTSDEKDSGDPKEVVHSDSTSHRDESKSNIEEKVNIYNKCLIELKSQIECTDKAISRAQEFIHLQDHALNMAFRCTKICSTYLNKIWSKLGPEPLSLLGSSKGLKKVQDYRGQLEKHMKDFKTLVHTYNAASSKVVYLDKTEQKYMKNLKDYYNEKKEKDLIMGKYKLGKEIGSGGYGVVYEAQDTKLGNAKRAVKEMYILSSDKQKIDQTKKAFKQEASFLMKLNNHHLPKIYAYIEEKDRCYLVMDFIEGETLEDRLGHGKEQTIYNTADSGIQLSETANYLHTQLDPIIFRDLKPANVIRNLDGHLYLVDFGIARHFKSEQQKDIDPAGSRGYIAPELYGNNSQPNVQSDIYSLGAILHYSLSGEDPAQRDFPFAFSHLPSPKNNPAGSQIIKLIEQMVDPDPNKRPPSMQFINQRLKVLLRELSPEQGDMLAVTPSPRAEENVQTEHPTYHDTTQFDLEL